MLVAPLSADTYLSSLSRLDFHLSDLIASPLLYSYAWFLFCQITSSQEKNVTTVRTILSLVLSFAFSTEVQVYERPARNEREFPFVAVFALFVIPATSIGASERMETLEKKAVLECNHPKNLVARKDTIARMKAIDWLSFS